MVCIKIYDNSGAAAAVEKLESPVYVYVQPGNGRILRCREAVAQGILGADGSCYYQLQSREEITGAAALAAVITVAEYEELLATMGTEEDPEDTNPEVPEGTEETDIMTRAELTEKVNELDEAMELLLSGVTE